MENPYVGHPSQSFADAWAYGFVTGYESEHNPIEPPAELDVDDGQPYSEGVQAGRQEAIDGLSLGYTCVSAAEPNPGHGVSLGIEATELLHVFCGRADLDENHEEAGNAPSDFHMREFPPRGHRSQP